MSGYQRTCDKLTSWLAEQLCALPARSTPIVGMDLNDGLGLVHVAGRGWAYDEKYVVPSSTASQAHYAGIAVGE
eukprot:3814867-Pyramimonas_sp.AAC.1